MIALAVVSAAALGIAAAMFAAYYAHPDDLWRDLYHDRNGHLAAGMNFALAIKTGDAGGFFTQLLAMRVWGPVHGLALAGVFLLGGVDHRLAIIPSLVGWAATAAFSFLIARRMFADRALGLFAGAMTSVWVIASPAFRLLGSDVMLEGLGAGLSAAALFAYARAREDLASRGRWRLLGVLLTALFFEKANYWGLIAASIGAAAASEFGDPWGRLRAAALDKGRRRRILGAAAGFLAHPLTFVFALLAGLSAAIYAHGPLEAALFGRRISLYPPENLVTGAYWALFARCWLFWRRGSLGQRLGVPERALVAWHAAPLAVSFLLPKRLAGFLWFVGPANSTPGAAYDPSSGARLYWASFADGFSVAAWSAALALVLAALAVGQARRFPKGTRATIACALLCALALVAHPQHQGRFLASWIFSVWICAGAGAALLLGWLIEARRGGLRALAAAAAATAFAAASILQPPAPLAAHYAIRTVFGPSDLDLVRPYLPALAGARVIGVAATFGSSELFRWATEERCQCKVIVESPWPPANASRAAVKAAMLAQIAASRADVWVAIDAPAFANSPVQAPYASLAGLIDAMRAQTRYAPVAVYRIPGEGASATLYRPAAAARRPAP